MGTSSVHGGFDTHSLPPAITPLDAPHNPSREPASSACLPRKPGVDTMTIKDLGRWESLEMVELYTRSVNFEDSLKLYQSILD